VVVGWLWEMLTWQQPYEEMMSVQVRNPRYNQLCNRLITNFTPGQTSLFAVFSDVDGTPTENDGNVDHRDLFAVFSDADR
jgi:hypothetical protein